MGQSPQNAPGVVYRAGSVTGMFTPPTWGAGVGEFQERMTRSPQTMTSPWLPTVLVGLVHSVQSTISTGLSGS